MQKKREIDVEALVTPISSGLLPCLYIPIAAKDEQAIEKYVGEIHTILASGNPNKAFFVKSYLPPEQDNRLPIWKLDESRILHYQYQVWVDVNYSQYRAAYRKAFPSENLEEFVLDHILNRYVARLKGFRYIRIIPISRSANSSSGTLVEQWSIQHHSSEQMRKKNSESKASIQYADLTDLVKMLNMHVGGGIMDVANEAQKLVDLPIT